MSHTNPAVEALKQCLEFIEELKDVTYHSEGMGCGLEDRGITNRYEAMKYGWDEALDRAFDSAPDVEELAGLITKLEAQAEQTPVAGVRILGYADSGGGIRWREDAGAYTGHLWSGPADSRHVVPREVMNAKERLLDVIESGWGLETPKELADHIAASGLLTPKRVLDLRNFTKDDAWGLAHKRSLELRPFQYRNERDAFGGGYELLLSYVRQQLPDVEVKT